MTNNLCSNLIEKASQRPHSGRKQTSYSVVAIEPESKNKEK